MWEPQSNAEEKDNATIKIWFFLKNWHICFNINSTSVIKSINQTKSIEILQHWNQQDTSCPSPQYLVDQIQVQKPILAFVADQMSDHT